MSVGLGARSAVHRLANRAGLLTAIASLGLTAVAAAIERASAGAGAVDRALATVFGLVLPIAGFALAFGPREYLALAVFALTAMAALSGGSFVRGLLSEKLPVAKSAQQTTVSILPHFDAGYWDVQGKTGTGSFIDARGAKAPLGWFIGWATHEERRVVFARMTAGGKKGEQPAGPAARDAFLKALPDLAKRF